MQGSAAAPLNDDARAVQRAPTWLDKQLLRELGSTWRKAYLFFGLAFLLLIGSALMVNPPTMATFVNSVGVSEIPIAQSYLPLVLLPILFFYNFLFSALRKTPSILVIVMCLIYSSVYAVIGIRAILSEHIETELAWILYYATNTKSVLFPVMFWSVMNDYSGAKTRDGTSFSKVVYPVLVTMGQLGGLVGSLVAANNHSFGGTPPLLIIQAVALLCVAVLVFIGSRLADAAARQDAAAAPDGISLQRASDELGASQAPPRGSSGSREEPLPQLEAPAQEGGCKAGCSALGTKIWEVFEGIYLIVTEPYVAGIFWVSCAHLVPRIILDYQGTSLINERWPKYDPDGHTIPGNKDKQTAFFAWCNLANTIGTLLLAQFGLRKLVERGGMAVTLLACPTAMLVSVLIVCFHHDFWTVQVTLVVVNVVQYALNGPCREFLYVQTSKNIKYKAKSWSDMYGNFLQKTLGAQINLHFNREIDSGPDACKPNCFNPGFTGAYTVVWVTCWAIIAALLGRTHSRLSKADQRIGENGVGCCSKVDPE